MNNLNEYLKQKREAVLIRHARDPLTIEPARLKAHVSAEGRSGVRRIRIRDHQVLSDSPADYAGYDLGPSSPELLLGCLGSCLTHIFLIKAAEAQLPLDALDVDIEGDLDPRGASRVTRLCLFIPTTSVTPLILCRPPARQRSRRCMRRFKPGVPFSTCSSRDSPCMLPCGTLSLRRTESSGYRLSCAPAGRAASSAPVRNRPASRWRRPADSVRRAGWVQAGRARPATP